MASAEVRKQAATTFKRWGRQDPELYVLLGVVGTLSAGGGYFLGSKRVNVQPENNVLLARGGEGVPWKDNVSPDSPDYKYKYHPNADPRNAPKEAPSALHSVVFKSVTLPAELHEKYNKNPE